MDRWKRLLLGLVMFISFTLGWASQTLAAQSDVSSNFDSPAGCTTVRAIIFDTPPSVGGAETWTYSKVSRCGSNLSQPPNEISAKIITQKWNGSTWVTCRDSGYAYNQQQSTLAYASTVAMGGVRLCGNGYYRNNAVGYVYHSSWQGGAVASGYLWLSQ